MVKSPRPLIISVADPGPLCSEQEVSLLRTALSLGDSHWVGLGPTGEASTLGEPERCQDPQAAPWPYLTQPLGQHVSLQT